MRIGPLEGPLPEGVRRLFFDHEDGSLAAAPALLVGRLLEHGDSADLAWLVERCGEGRLTEWFERRGGRQLSRRSRAFWSRVLAAESGPAAHAGEALWPL